VIVASERQTMNHIVDTCPSTKSEGGLNLLHEADDDAVIRLESAATAALAKKNESASLLHQDPSTSSSSYTPVYSVGVYCGSPRPFLMATYDDAVRSMVSNGYIK